MKRICTYAISQHRTCTHGTLFILHVCIFSAYGLNARENSLYAILFLFLLGAFITNYLIFG